MALRVHDSRLHKLRGPVIVAVGTEGSSKFALAAGLFGWVERSDDCFVPAVHTNSIRSEHILHLLN